MERLRLAVFNTQPPHLYLGGVERRIIETGKRLSQEIDVSVYSGTKAGFHVRTTYDGINIIPCKSTDRIFPLDNWTFNRCLAKKVDLIDADVYESHNVSGYGFQNAIKKRKKRVPFIATIHGVLADEYEKNLKNKMTQRERTANFFMKRLARIEEESAKDATLVVTISKYSQSKIEELYHIEKGKVRIVPNGVDVNRFRPTENCQDLRKRFKADNREIVLFVGRLIPRKGLQFLIDAAELVVKQKKVVFVIAGNGPLREPLLNEVNKRSLNEYFKFTGDISEDELPRVYGCSDVFVLPSVQEGQGIVLLEAQASAKPVVAFNVGAIAETVADKVSGLLVEPRAGDLANGLLRLLSDKSLRIKYGERGRERVVREASWEACANRMLNIYEEAASIS